MRSSIKHSLAQPLQKCSQLCIHNSIHTLSLESYGSSCLHTPIDSTHSSSKGRQRIAAEQSSVRWWIFSRGYTPPENDSVPGNLALPCNTRNPSLQGFRILNCCQNCRSHFYGWFWSYLVFLYIFLFKIAVSQSNSQTFLVWLLPIGMKWRREWSGTFDTSFDPSSCCLPRWPHAQVSVPKPAFLHSLCYVCFIVSLASPWMMALYSSLALIKPELSLSASFPCASNNSFPNNRAIAACFDVFRIAVKEPRAFTSSVVNTKPSTCPSRQKWESIHQEQSKTFKLLTETGNLDQETTSKTQKKL